MLTLEPGLPDRHVVLIGAPGAGTSTIGHLLAARFHRRLLDGAPIDPSGVGAVAVADDPARPRTGGGDPEAELLLDQLATFLPAVIAAGAVVVDDRRVRDALDGRHTVVWLDGDPDVLARRAERGTGGTRLDGDGRRSTRAERLASVADLIVDVTVASPETVVDQVVAGLGTRTSRPRTRTLLSTPSARRGRGRR